MKKYSLLLLVLLLIACNQQVPQKSTLLKSNWKFSQVGDSIWYPAKVPGVVQTDLLKNQLIDNPFWETNELKLQWIETQDWQYRTRFNLSNQQLKQEHIEIEFEGLDTYAEVFLNGTKIISANNMFRTWKANIKSLVKADNNLLEVNFTSPINYNREQIKNYHYQLPSGNETVPLKVSPFTRKAAYQFGWDFGPRFVTSGIWKNININTWHQARIADIFIQTDSISLNKAYLTYHLDFDIQNSEKENYTIEINDMVIKTYLSKAVNQMTFKKVIDNPQLWWPNGSGKPHLYQSVIKLKKGSELLAEKKQTYGIRTVTLIQENDSIGESFYFKINGKPLFIKGANYIPQDVFLPNVTDENYRKLIAKVVKLNMNMIRVWGGGIYEKDLFYDLCDQNGILVWQDFMFAGSLYPNTSEFLDNVKQEVTENIIRLRQHPSVALWCGNNEIEVAWKNWGWQRQYGYSPKDSVLLWHQYQNLFQKLIPTTLKSLDTTANYVSTTPLSNWGTPKNFNYGSMHYWGVWHGREPFKNFKNNVGRFMVEYGFQSFPSMKTIKTFAVDSSLYLQSKTMLNRQKSYIGNGLLTTHINRWFDEPKSFADFVYKSQQTQAIAMQIAIQSHRLQSPHNMGTLFWQLNDCWPGPSWSVIDYYGNEKLAFNTVAENYKSLIVVLDSDKNEVEILSDNKERFKGKLILKNKRETISKDFKFESQKRLKIAINKAFFRTKSKTILVELYKNDTLKYCDTVYNER